MKKYTHNGKVFLIFEDELFVLAEIAAPPVAAPPPEPIKRRGRKPGKKRGRPRKMKLVITEPVLPEKLNAVEEKTEGSRTRLTDEQVEALRAEYATGETTSADLCKKYKISLPNFYKKVKGITRGTKPARDSWGHAIEEKPRPKIFDYECDIGHQFKSTLDLDKTEIRCPNCKSTFVYYGEPRDGEVVEEEHAS